MWFNSKLKSENNVLKQQLAEQQHRHQIEIDELKAMVRENETMQQQSRQNTDLFNEVIVCQNQGGRDATCGGRWPSPKR